MSSNLSRRGLLAMCGGAAAWASVRGTPLAWAEPVPEPKRKARNLVLVLTTGGWDPFYALDPKPGVATADAPSGQIRSFGDLPVFVDPSRPKVTTFFEKYASLCAVVNGVQMQSFVHPDCWKRILTGTASDANPDMGAITAYELGRDLPAPYLVLGHTAYSGPLASIATRVGSSNQILALLSPSAGYRTVSGAAPQALDADESDLVRAYVKARGERALATRGQRGSNRAQIQDFLSSLDRGDRLKGFASGFGKRGLALSVADQAMLAGKALESGLCRAVHLEDAGWDTHDDNSLQGQRHDALFGTLTLLADDLAARRGRESGATLLDETVIAVVSEMGRTPKLNAAKGKDHWPVTSALVFGAGVKGGRAYGATSDGLEALSTDVATGKPDTGGKQIQFGNLVAGILSLAGVDSTLYVPKLEAFDAFAA
jgi:uncharacterized protein (DUF1501 family)